MTTENVSRFIEKGRKIRFGWKSCSKIEKLPRTCGEAYEPRPLFLTPIFRCMKSSLATKLRGIKNIGYLFISKPRANFRFFDPLVAKLEF